MSNMNEVNSKTVNIKHRKLKLVSFFWHADASFFSAVPHTFFLSTLVLFGWASILFFCVGSFLHQELSSMLF